MKKIYMLIAVLLTLLFSNTLFSTACIAAESSKPIILKLAHFVPARSFLGQQHQWWASEVEKRTGGRIKVRMFWMQSLVKTTDMLQAVKAGIADIGWVCSTYWPSNFPLYMMLDNMGNCVPDYGAVILACLDTSENEPHLKAELEREKVMNIGPYLSGSAQYGFKKCLTSFMDIKGKTVRTYGSSGTKHLEFMGANPIFMSYNDLYEAIDRGTLDGFALAVVLSDAFKHYEVVKCVYMTHQGAAVACGLTMNRDAFYKLPKDLQKILLDFRKEFGLRYAQALQDLESETYNKWASKYGVTIKELTPEESQFNEKAIVDAREAMIKKQESEGHKWAREVWNHYYTALRRYQKERAR